MTRRVVVAMSGGVDSSVAAALLKEQGNDVIGITMRLWTEPRPEGFSGRTLCCGIEDIDDARRVAQTLDIPHYTLNLERPFKRFVVDPFVDEYARGRTPNPCLNCNTFIKFDLFYERAIALKADFIATGHYARRVDGPQGVELHRAQDTDKDQSYVLYTLTRQALERTLFPLGELRKEEVREIAQRHHLAVAGKPDSVDICFVPGGDYRDFVRDRLADRPGTIVDRAGTTVAAHDGVQHFTIGQRRGLGVALGDKTYVTGIDADRNRVQIGPPTDLDADQIEVQDVRWLIDPPPDAPIPVEAKVRYRTPPVAATVQANPTTLDGSTAATITFDQPVRAAAPGQAVVWYQGQRVVGGGTIAATNALAPEPETAQAP